MLTVVTPSDPQWDATRQVFNLTTDLRPAAVALPRDADDAIAAVRHASERGLRVAAQATGHNAAPHGAIEDTLLVDVRELQEISIDPDARRVRVGAGVRWERVVPQLSELGLAALHGSSPNVGVAGYSLGGGMGWLARKHGLQANSVTAIEIVTADGDLVRTDHDNEPDLFWALRGGNGNFGVVTALEFEVFSVPELYAGAMFFPVQHASDVLHAWRELLPTAPDELMTWANLMRFPDDEAIPEPVRGGSFAIVMAAFLGAEADGRALLEPVRALGPAIDSFAMVAPDVLGDLAMDPPEPLPFELGHHLLGDVPAAGIDELLTAVRPGSELRLDLVQLRHMGGALARRDPGAGARATLPGSISLLGLGVVADEGSAQATATSLASLLDATRAYRIGDYPNFVERSTDTSSFFDAATWTRLRDVKAAYDPRDLFKGNHHIAPAGARLAAAA